MVGQSERVISNYYVTKNMADLYSEILEHLKHVDEFLNLGMRERNQNLITLLRVELSSNQPSNGTEDTLKRLIFDEINKILRWETSEECMRIFQIIMDLELIMKTGTDPIEKEKCRRAIEDLRKRKLPKEMMKEIYGTGEKNEPKQ